tara:strand:- start:175 stop:654 length:480 start_codon:yes stop_codon:yes gene_type:complete
MLFFALIVLFCGNGCTPKKTQSTNSTPSAQSEKVQEANTDKKINVEIIVKDNPINGEQLHIKKVQSPKDGWLVIYESINNTPGTVIGHTPITKGEQYDIKLNIHDIVQKDILFVQLHDDTKKIGRFEYPLHDKPMKNTSPQPLILPKEHNATTTSTKYL